MLCTIRCTDTKARTDPPRSRNHPPGSITGAPPDSRRPQRHRASGTPTADPPPHYSNGIGPIEPDHRNHRAARRIERPSASPTDLPTTQAGRNSEPKLQLGAG
ncbi:hypothetical protein AOQ84DRAFT_381698 [Glonium stellatum]|uniref:Uncharacterized protein n=1 Tax=Glonium stellatum TaxID=574774 RepID=A0A8E2JN59_9PEZI|nr:hypothetical protein AOQ84DRAFT_381698 [Glonium stellatum]